MQYRSSCLCNNTNNTLNVNHELNDSFSKPKPIVSRIYVSTFSHIELQCSYHERAHMISRSSSQIYQIDGQFSAFLNDAYKVAR